MALKPRSKFIFIALIIVFCFLSLPLSAKADTVGQTTVFFVEPIYDEFTRNTITAILRKVSPKAYFYFDNKFWNSLDSSTQVKMLASVDVLALEFENRIYPTLTSNFGSEWLPGIDKDEKITILIHPMDKGVGGYFDSADEYPKLQAPSSNQREMVYLNTEYIDKEIAKTYLAHEFTHLITFNQKDIVYEVSEETWLNEARAEYVSTLLGYDEEFDGSNLETRQQEFISNPTDPLTEWQNKQADYGVISMFTHYLVDHYGVKILTDSLKSSQIGIPSINTALKENGFSKDFSQVFADWVITVLVNDCDLGQGYCYKNSDLKNFTITPFINFLPFVGKSSLSITDYTKEWAGNWYKIVGGKGILKLEFVGENLVDFTVPYVITGKTGKGEIGFLDLDKNQHATIYVPDFNTENTALTIIPLAQSKVLGFGISEPAYQFSFAASTVEKTPEQEQEQEQKQEQERLAKIESLKKQITLVQVAINAILAQKQKANAVSCEQISANLYYGLQQSSQVRCLQEFLKSQGSGIYPEALVTGNFFSLTQKAVIRFQEKYAQEILFSLGLSRGTGYVGERTRAKINELIR